MSYTLPTILTYERSINPTDAYLYGVSIKDGEEIRTPVVVEQRGLVAAMSNAKDIKKFSNKGSIANEKANNLQIIDYAALPYGSTALSLNFSLVFVGNSHEPKSFSGDGIVLVEKLKEAVALYKEKGGFSELAYRYLDSLVSGMPLWRNRTTGGAMKTVITCGDDEFVFTSEDGAYPSIEQDHDLVSRVAKTLGSKGEALRLDVVITMDKPAGCEVFPSQCYTGEKKGRVLESVTVDGKRYGIMHQQKVGNAIRTIDDWYVGDEDDGEVSRKLPVEPYGIDRKRNVAIRAVNKTDLYSQMTTMLEKMVSKLRETGDTAPMHYLVACLIRGGVFNK